MDVSLATAPQHQLNGCFPPVVWHAPLRDPTGYAEEARNFLFALHAHGAPVAAREIRWNNRLAGLTTAQEDILSQLLGRAALPSSIYVHHILGHLLRPAVGARASVGRTMFETDRLPAGWAEACNQMDAVWVPTAFNQETFARAGVRPEKLRVVPGLIELSSYNPLTPPLALPGARGYNFLAIFDWSLRKGWDVLIAAFVQAFRPDEDVALFLHVHSSLGYTTHQIYSQIEAFLCRKLGRNPDSIPDIILLDQPLSTTEMVALYCAAQCYVLPTRGEGWGRPFMEAMALQRPVIATGWSGQTAFMTPENSLLVEYTLQEVSEEAAREIPIFRGHRWAEPSQAHLSRLMRQVFEDRALGKELGAKARAHLERFFSPKPVMEILQRELTRLWEG